MRVTGVQTAAAPAEAVRAALRDPGALARAIPGCERLEAAGPGRLALTVTVAIAAVAGTYSGEAEAREPSGDESLAARLSLAGGRGRVGADVTVSLTPAGETQTEVGYDIDAQVDGAIAGVGKLVLVSVAHRLARQFIAGLAAPAGPAPALARVTASSVPAMRAPAGAGPAMRAAVVSAAAAGLAGIVIGVMLGRQSRTGTGRGRR